MNWSRYTATRTGGVLRVVLPAGRGSSPTVREGFVVESKPSLTVGLLPGFCFQSQHRDYCWSGSDLVTRFIADLQKDKGATKIHSIFLTPS